TNQPSGLSKPSVTIAASVATIRPADCVVPTTAYALSRRDISPPRKSALPHSPLESSASSTATRVLPSCRHGPVRVVGERVRSAWWHFGGHVGSADSAGAQP